MQVYYQPLVGEGVNHLDPDESRHATKVMRYKVGDPLTISDGKGHLYDSTISEITKTDCHFEISQVRSIPRRDFSIRICIAPTKNMDRMEWFVEKAVEIGIESIGFMNSANAERKIINTERLRKKAVSALKQSGQAWLPSIEEIQPFEKHLTFEGQQFIAFVDHTNRAFLKDARIKSNYVVLIGPEGDFTNDEVERAVKAGFKMVSLGPHTLRTETAALVACHTLNLINQ
ncbi:MAG: RsmE family RNA methyltransferase [Cyclobacteriaceae bacterium]